MNRFFGIIAKIFGGTAGSVATASFVICAISGIFLAIPYKIADPFDSVSLILLDNPSAAFFRNIHYWSAQLFLVFTLLHIIDHFIQNTEFIVGKGIWTRLILSLPVVFFVMISGFILKGDPDALSAHAVLSGLLNKIPFAGSLINDSLLVSGSSLELVYIHHVASATIILIIIIIEHSRRIWPLPSTFIILLLSTLILSFFLHPSFGRETGAGPWYFIGFQEILLWSPNPGRTWWLFILLIVLIWVLPRLVPRFNLRMKFLLLAFLLFYVMISITGAFFRDSDKNLTWPWQRDPNCNSSLAFHPLTLTLADDPVYVKGIPRINGQREACLLCHDNVTGFSPAHAPEAVGCYTCHRGDPFTLNKRRAHKNMILIPGNVEDAWQTCGSASCHPDIPARINSSLMTSMSGVVTVDRFVFGEETSLSQLAHIKDIGHSAADQHLRDLCANCHLGHEKVNLGPVSQISRGGGCNACHLNYTDSARLDLQAYQNNKSIIENEIFHHPQLNLNVTDEHCFGCHSRSGRIATSYQGWHETMFDAEKIPEKGKFRVLEDERVLEFISEDVHHQKGMSCTDCHISYELMGDGKAYAHKEEQVMIRCEDCHFTQSPSLISYPDLDSESKKIIAQRRWEVEGKLFLTTKAGNRAMINAWKDSTGHYLLRTKSGDTLLPLKTPLPVCLEGGSHKALSCESCHTAWTPQCIGCHNVYDERVQGFDMLEYKEKQGSWVEHVGVFLAGAPTLGVVRDSTGSKMIKTFTPGMIISIDQQSFSQNKKGEPDRFLRLYSPISAHTTIREGRSCKSCHLDPLAIGYGRGELVYDMTSGRGRWSFRSNYAPNAYDSLPEDAWIGFLENPPLLASTRENARPFNLEEQRAILAVGACLTCHEEGSAVIKASLSDFPALLKKISPKCVLPDWE